MNTLLQNALLLSIIVGFAATEFLTRRYQATVRASANDTQLELWMFLSLLAVAQPVALLTTNWLCGALMPAQRGARSTG